jgi:hypothetical protein
LSIMVAISAPTFEVYGPDYLILTIIPQAPLVQRDDDRDQENGR